MEIGSSIRKIRKEKGIRQMKLAEKAGISQTYLSQLETGDKPNPSLSVVRDICNSLGVTIDELLLNSLRTGDLSKDQIKRYLTLLIALL